MPMHDWTLVQAGIFHAFHHRWISAIGDILNERLLPRDYYALPERVAAGFEPDVLTLRVRRPDAGDETAGGGIATVTRLQTRPQTRFTAETDAEFYHRKKSAIAVRHVSGDRLVAVIEILSPGNKSSRNAFRAFVVKVWKLLEYRIHLLLIDPFPPGPRDPNGVHAAIWVEVKDDSFVLPDDTPLTLAAYECNAVTRAYIEPVAVGDPLPDMPLFLEPNGCIAVPLEATYQTALAVMPRRWRDELQLPTTG